MTYVDDAYNELRGEMPGLRYDLLRLYALLALTTGEKTTLENVHDAWSVWTLEKRPDHPSLVPFDELPRETQELDREYADAIRLVARRLRGGRRRRRDLLPYQRPRRPRSID